MLGDPLEEQELHLVQSYLKGLALGDSMLESVPDWNTAALIISSPEWDRRWWDAEQLESDRLRARAYSAHGEQTVMRRLSAGLVQVSEAAHGAAAAAATRCGCRNAELIRAAAGALSQTLYLAELACLAGEPPTHPFLLKKALFEGGHWPLCIVNARFYVF